MGPIQFSNVNIRMEGLDLIRLPEMLQIRQKFDRQEIDNIMQDVSEKMNVVLAGHADNGGSLKGKRICITVGSRGIPDLDRIIRAVVDSLKNAGANPFIIPAMGSHGGGTAEGQKELIAGYNITEDSMGVPVCASMETVLLGELDDGTPVYLDRFAFESDGIIVLNKVKPHTDFRAEHESGMAKMMAIGMANHKGASMFHMKGFQSFGERIPKVAEFMIEHAPVLFGIGIVQNAYDRICEIEIVPKEEILEADRRLLVLAKERMARFIRPEMDVLIIDEIGKNISGNGHDPNITGRSNSPGFEKGIDIKRLFIRGLNEETHHNACGLGVADITTKRCLEQVDFELTWTNVTTSMMISGGRIPMYANTDKEALLLAIRTAVGADYDNPKIVRIKDTLHMDEIEVSAAYYEMIKDEPEIELIRGAQPMRFDEDGMLE